MQRPGSGRFVILLNSHVNVSSNGEIFSVEDRRNNISSIIQILDKVYNLDWFSSASENQYSAAVGFKWMLNLSGNKVFEFRLIDDSLVVSNDFCYSLFMLNVKPKAAIIPHLSCYKSLRSASIRSHWSKHHNSRRISHVSYLVDL